MAPIRAIGRKQKLLDLLSSEEGNADRGKALAAGAVLGGSVLAQMLVTASAHAHACAPDSAPCNEFNFMLCRNSSAGPGHECFPSCGGGGVFTTCTHQG